MTPVRLEPAAPRSRVKHSTAEPLRSLGTAKWQTTILPPYVGYAFQGRMSDLSRDLSAVKCQKDTFVGLSCFTYLIVSIMDKG